MTTVHARLIGGKVVLSRDEFECLVELERQSERIELQIEEDDVPTAAISDWRRQVGRLTVFVLHVR